MSSLDVHDCRCVQDSVHLGSMSNVARSLRHVPVASPSQPAVGRSSASGTRPHPPSAPRTRRSESERVVVVRLRQRCVAVGPAAPPPSRWRESSVTRVDRGRGTRSTAGRRGGGLPGLTPGGIFPSAHSPPRPDSGRERGVAELGAGDGADLDVKASDQDLLRDGIVMDGVVNDDRTGAPIGHGALFRPEECGNGPLAMMCPGARVGRRPTDPSTS